MAKGYVWSRHSERPRNRRTLEDKGGACLNCGAGGVVGGSYCLDCQIERARNRMYAAEAYVEDRFGDASAVMALQQAREALNELEQQKGLPPSRSAFA
jgi:hypothetical protein